MECKASHITLLDLALTSSSFLLAKLHMNHLMGFLTVRQMKNALVQSPRGTTGLELAYDQAMPRITSQGDSNQGRPDDDDSQSKVALRALSWLTISKTALTADQLAHAIGTKPGMTDPDRENLMDPNTIDSLCAGLIAFGTSHHKGIPAKE